MIAMQSHAMLFEDFPVTRVAWPGKIRKMAEAASGFISCTFTAVIVGIMDIAMYTAYQQLEKRQSALRAYEQVEWAQAAIEGWLIQQAYEGMLRAVELKGTAAGQNRYCLAG